MSSSRLFHFSQRVINVAAVVLMISANVDHRALECVVRPNHAARVDINVAGGNDYVRIAWCWIEWSKAEVQI
ncbi:hypothetical protein PS834_05622 [Pseudomonas fluorescens]|nr:hypothetical protein PS834_05622 [Pseudomonas fluorescens]